MAFTRWKLEVRQPVVTWSCYVLSLAIPVLSVVLTVRDPDSRALHDRAARTRVVVARA